MPVTAGMALDSVAAWFLFIIGVAAACLDLYLATTNQPTITSVVHRWSESFPMLRWVGIGLCYHLFVAR